MAAGDAFDVRGFAVLPQLLTGREVYDFGEAVGRLRAKRPVGACDRPNNVLVPLRWNDAPVVAALEDGTRMRRVAQASGGNDLRWTSAYLSIKDPRSGALWWHQDWWCWDHPVSYRREAAQMALLCYLQDTTVRTGALRVLPGSHTASTRLHSVLPEAHRDPHGVSAGNVALEDQPDQVTLELRAGDAVLLDYRLLHGTHPNASDCRRDCLILNFTPSWRGLPDDIRSHLIRRPQVPAGGRPG